MLFKKHKSTGMEVTKEAKQLANTFSNISNCSDDELCEVLSDDMDECNISKPWDGDFDDFMSNPNNHLVFD